MQLTNSVGANTYQPQVGTLQYFLKGYRYDIIMVLSTLQPNKILVDVPIPYSISRLPEYCISRSEISAQFYSIPSTSRDAAPAKAPLRRYSRIRRPPERLAYCRTLRCCYVYFFL